jgi:hypothetical protein
MLVEMADPAETSLPFPLPAEERPFTVDDLGTMPGDGRRYEAWELGGENGYRRVAAVVGDELYETVNPYPLADLVRER